MADELNQAAGELAARAQEVLNAAKSQAVESLESLNGVAVDAALQSRIRACQEAIESAADEIEGLRERIASERASAQEELVRGRQAAQAAEAEVERMKAQIAAREGAAAGLTGRAIVRDFGPLGKVTMPDPNARAEVGAILVEVAGLRAALASAEGTSATTRQAVDAFEAELDMVPIDADPRMIQLYAKLGGQKKTLATLTQQALTTLTSTVERILSEDNQRAIARLAAQKITTPFPNDVEADLFYDAIEKVESALTAAIPKRALEMIRGTAGISGGDADGYVARLTGQLSKSVDIPMLGEEDEATFFELLVRLFVDAMKSGNTIDGLLNGHATDAPTPRLVEPPPAPVAKQAKKTVKRSRSKKAAKKTKSAKKARRHET